MSEAAPGARVDAAHEVGHEATRLAQALGVTLRRARAADADDFTAMMNDDSVYPQTMQLPYTGADFWRQHLAKPGGPESNDLNLVVESQGRVVASGGLSGMPRVRRRHAMLLGITVAGHAQGGGLGKLLMTALCHAGDRWFGALRIELTVFVDNPRAIGLYLKHGFEVEGTHRAFALRDGVYVDVLTMARLSPFFASSHAAPPTSC